MNPLSPFTYFRRHKRKALLLASLITMATVGLYILVAVLDTLPMRAQYSYLTRVSRVYPAAGGSLDPAVVSRLRVHPDVAHVVPNYGLDIWQPILVGSDQVRVSGVYESDVEGLMDAFDLRLKEGRLFTPRTNEIVLVKEAVQALGLRLGDQIDRSVDEYSYSAIPSPLVLVGILEGDPAAGSDSSVRVGFVSYEYFESHEQFASSSADWLVIPREDRKEAVDDLLENEILSTSTEVETFREIAGLASTAQTGLHVTFGILNSIVAVAVALVVGVINRIALARRLGECGLLHALGRRKTWLVRRLTLETAAVAVSGWVIGLLLAALILNSLKTGPYRSMGMDLDLSNPAPFWFVVPIPLAVIAFSAWGAMRVFSRFDAVSIVERGKLSMEEDGKRQVAQRSANKPLAARTFYRRHRRRAITLVLGTTLMVLAVAFPVFLTSTVTSAVRPYFAYLRFTAEVSPVSRDAVDPGVTAQIKRHPDVTRVVPVMPLELYVDIPPLSGTGINIWGVTEEHLPHLMSKFDVDLIEGRLPRARSNEVVLSEALALNRGLQVGDVIGGAARDETEPAASAYDGIPTEMEVVGLLSSGDLWLGFASYEYLNSHEMTASWPVHLLVVPAEGHKAAVDAWLEESVASAQTEVKTYATEQSYHQELTWRLVLVFAVLEGIIALVAAVALATLNFIFFEQRRQEFGILNALGRSRVWLVLRSVRETGSTVALAWLIGAAVYGLLLLYVQANIYTPKGLNLDLLDPTPWLFTLPIPLVVVGVGAGMTFWIVSKLDPVSIIEKR
jgi:ABC-type lipoprotein release transport system permease subunit